MHIEMQCLSQTRKEGQLGTIKNTHRIYMLNFLNQLKSQFLDHPKQVCMDYKTHCQFALYMAKLHAYGAYASIVHAFFPWWYPSEVTFLNQQIATLLENSGCRNKET